MTRYIDAAREGGYGIDLITINPSLYRQYDDDAGVRIFAIGDAEHRRFTPRLKRRVIVTIPRRVFGFARARAKGLPSPLPEAVIVHAQAKQQALARKFDVKIYNPWYQVVRPRVLWKITRRRVLPQLDMAHTRRVVVHGVLGVTTGWGLAKRDATIPVSTDLTPLHVETPARSGGES